MPRGRQLPPIEFTDGQHEQLTALSRSTSMPHSLVLRARIVLACAEGLTNTAVADRLGTSLPTVGKWRRRFPEQGVQGLHDGLRPGRPRTYDDERVAGTVNRALREKPANANVWSVRLVAGAEGVSKSTVQRWFALFGVKPHRSKTFKLSSDPFFVEKVRDVIGLAPPRRTTPWYCVWTKKARFRHSTEPSRHCRWDSAMSRATPMPVSATEPRRCSPPLALPPAR